MKQIIKSNIELEIPANKERPTEAHRMRELLRDRQLNDTIRHIQFSHDDLIVVRGQGYIKRKREK